jgi:mannonate dehydratase
MKRNTTMKMGFRWYGEGNDTITLDEIRQIPGVETIVWSLHHKQAGQVWETAEIDAEMARITTISAAAAARGVTTTLDAEVVESVVAVVESRRRNLRAA